MIVASTYTEGMPQVDGRRYVKETHLLDDGRTVDFDYLADATISPAAVMAERATRLNEQLSAQAAVSLEAANGTLPMTKYKFRQLFTPSEQKAIDRFNVQFEAHPVLTEDQKDDIRTGIENFKAVQDVSLSDPATIGAVTMYEMLGLIAPGRASEILSG